MGRQRPLWLWLGLLATCASGALAADRPTEAEVRFFEAKVRPLLAQNCYDCHGADLQEGKLRLDSPAGILKGSKSGVIVVPGKPSESLLITAVGYQLEELQMPPENRLPKTVVADLVRWVKMGAPLPGPEQIKARAQRATDLKEARSFWAFQAPVDPPRPQVNRGDWPQSELDLFVLARLEAKGLSPAPPADKRTLIRRATFDLTGLPPTPAEVQAFLDDTSAGAFARVVDRLLASPQYGERWGRHWLDVARYADSNGLDENLAHGNAWRYRDYVVAAFNDDKPYDQFVREQLAGDLLPAQNESERHEHLIATGFLSLGPKVLAEVDERKMEMDIIDEQVDTVGKSLMGLTLGCARCHDHKFDPISTRDYYGLAGIFKSTHTMDSFKKIAKWHENLLPTDAFRRQKAEHDKRLAAQQAAIEKFIQAANQKLSDEGELPEKPEEAYDEPTKARLKQLRDELAKLKKNAPQPNSAMGVTEGKVTDVKLHIRGSHLALGETVPRHLPPVLAAAEQPPFPSDHSGRLRLARWLASPAHPLTARVMVNRVWRWHFGEGIVRTPDNFGRLGERPTHPALLDWLTCRFVEDGWSIKALHRRIMLSSTYQMSSRYDAKSAEVDPENRLLWRRDIRRLEAEALRDALLAVSGQLDLTMGGSLLHVKNREFIFNHTSQDETRYNTPRRSLYVPVVRNHLYEVFQLFDYSDASVMSGDRATTIVAPQALFMLNSDFFRQQCEKLAGRLAGDAEDARSRIRRLYELAYARPPKEAEIARARQFLDRYQQTATDPPQAMTPRQQAWQALCQVILSANEFIFVR